MLRIVPLAAVVAAAGCARPVPPTAPAAAPAASEASEAPAEATAQCRDWSELDLASLPALPKAKHVTHLDEAWRTLLEKHPDPTLGCLDWPGLRTSYAEKLVGVDDQGKAFKIINQMLRELGQSHIGIMPARRAPADGEGPRGTGVIPIGVRYLSDKLVVVDSNAYGLRSGIPAGASVLAIADREVAPLAERMREAWKRDVEVSFWVGRTAQMWLTCKPGSKTPVTYSVATKGPKTKNVRCREPKVERATYGHMRDIPIELESKMLPGKVGYVRFNIWLFPLMSKIESAIASLRKQGMEALVIDLRGNPGGVGMMTVPLGRQVMTEDASLGVLRMRKMEQNFKVTADDAAFAGRVAVLVDEGSASTSEIFAQALQDLGRVQVVGASSSQGAVLGSLFEELPSGAILQLVVADYQSPGGATLEGVGVIPDVKVQESIEDFANGRDAVLDAAVAAVTNQEKK